MVFILISPFASRLPDGLEKVVETYGVKEKNIFWNGIMKDYYIESITNPVNSTVTAGIFGFFMVLITALFLGKRLETQKYHKI